MEGGGHFKDIHGSIEFDPTQPSPLAIEAAIDAQNLWSGEPQREIAAAYFVRGSFDPLTSCAALWAWTEAGMSVSLARRSPN